MPNALYLLPVLLAYLLGSIPFGLVVMRFAGQGDVRKIGSGNIGATNVLRTGRKDLAALTLLLDAAKGFFAVVIAWRLGVSGYFIYSVGLMAVLGHIFPAWLKFKGGKGVATAIGVMLGISFGLGWSIIAVWLIIFIVSRTSSLSALVSFAVNCLTAALAGPKGSFLFMLLLVAILCYTHRQNIARIRAGTEPRFGEKP